MSKYDNCAGVRQVVLDETYRDTPVSGCVIKDNVIYDVPLYGIVISDNSMQNAYSPDRLTRDQLKALLGWPHADPCVTREMMVVAVKSRLHLGRLSIEDVAAA